MSFGAVGLLAIAGYLAVLAVLGERARRARLDLTPADHFLAARSLGPWVLFLTLYATAYSGNSLLGYPGEAYRRGFAWIMATGFMMAILVVFHALVPGLRPVAVREGLVTPGDYLRARYGEDGPARLLRVACALLMTIALANFLLAQLTAIGIVTVRATEGMVPYAAGVVALAAVMLAYETVGGMRAVAWTDVFQGLLMLVGLAAMLEWLLREAGGLAALTRAIAEARPDAVAVPSRTQQANWASSVVLMGVASVVYPQAIQRIYAARDAAALRRALALMTFMPLTTTLVVTWIGLAAIPLLPGLAGARADEVMPALLARWAETGAAGTVLAVLVLVGALAAIMSTADSVLLSLGSIVAEDLLGWPRGDPATTRVGKRAAAAILVAAVALALLPRLTLWRLIELKMELLIQCAPAFLLGVRSRRLRAAPVAAGLVLGTGIAVAGVLAGRRWIGGVHVGVLGLGANLALVAALAAAEALRARVFGARAAAVPGPAGARAGARGARRREAADARGGRR